MTLVGTETSPVPSLIKSLVLRYLLRVDMFEGPSVPIVKEKRYEVKKFRPTDPSRLREGSPVIIFSTLPSLRQKTPLSSHTCETH